ncbi:MAG: GYD domain-containing protein [Burkholderiales bacterium]
MATYVVLASFTDQGARNVKDSPERLVAFKAMAEKMGVTVKSAHYTVGAYDIVVTVEGSDEAVTAVLLKLATLGNIRTQTLRAFSPEEMRTIVAKIG